MNCTVSKYGKEWGIFCPITRCYILFGTKKEMGKRCKELNEMEGSLTINHSNGWTTHIHVTKD